MSSRKLLGVIFGVLGMLISYPCLSYGSNGESAPVFQVADEYRYWIDFQNSEPDLTRIAQASREWEQRGKSSVNFGYQQSPVWLRFDLHATSLQAFQLIMELGSAHLERVDFYLTQTQGQDIELISARVIGDQDQQSKILLKHRFPIFAINISQPGEYQVFVRIRTSSAVIFPVNFKRPETFFPEEAKVQVFYGLFFGTMLVLAFYNGMAWVFVRERAYLYNMAFIAVIMLYQSTINGFGHFYLWPQYDYIDQKTYIAGTLLSIYFAGRFALRFLDLRNRLPRLEKVTFYFIQIFLVMLVPAFFLPERLVMGVIYILEMLVCLYAIGVILYECLNGNYWARYLLAGWTILIVGTLCYVLSRLGWIEYTPTIEYIHAAGLSLGNLLVTSTLAVRIQKERLGKNLALERALALAQEVTDLTREKEQIAASSSQELEQRVEQKTETLRLMLRQLQSNNEKLEHATVTDALTGIGNRRLLDASFADVINQCQQHRTSLGVLVIDADYFKRINDIYGHLVGDRCLQHIAGILEQYARRNLDLLVRYGGEEFILILPATDVHGVLNIAEDIRAAIESSGLKVQGQVVKLTVSVGVSVCIPDASIDAESLLLRADEALYLAKRKGRNRVEVYDDGFDPLKA